MTNSVHRSAEQSVPAGLAETLPLSKANPLRTQYPRRESNPDGEKQIYLLK